MGGADKKMLAGQSANTNGHQVTLYSINFQILTIQLLPYYLATPCPKKNIKIIATLNDKKIASSQAFNILKLPFEIEILPCNV